MKTFSRTLLLLFALFLTLTLLGACLNLRAVAQPPALTILPSNTAPIRDFAQLNSTNGWLLLGQDLYLTHDAGESWSIITPPGAAELWTATFLDERQGWAISSPDPGAETADEIASKLQLSTTTDGGASWQTVDLSLDPFPDLPGVPPEAVYLSFSDPLTGWLVFKRPTSSNFNIFVGYQTYDGGQTWQPLPDAEFLASLTPSLPEPEMPLTKVEMLDAESGWALEVTGACNPDQSKDSRDCTQNQRLLSTSDGGQSWLPLALPQVEAPTPEALAPFAPELIAAGQGFDKCEVATLAQLQEWWTQSPYSAVNLYIGGIMRACANSALTPAYLSAIDRQGWTLIPTWVGLQASCSGLKYVMSSNAAEAYNQGVAEADAAAQVATDLKLWGQPIYYDLENFNASNTACLNAAHAFIEGWTFRMHEWGFVAGEYGSPCSGLSGVWNLENAPEAVWIAHWLTPYAYNPDATVWTTVCSFSNSYWPNHQRLRQYAGGHNETWGSVTLKIDSNAMDGMVAQAFGQPQQACPRPAAPAQAGVILYTAADYDCYGRQSGFGYLWRDRSGFQNLDSFFDNRASSIYIPTGWSVRLYENLDRGGGKVCINAPGDEDFAGQTFDNGANLDSRTSSFEVFAGLNCSQAAPVTPAVDAQPPTAAITSQANGGWITNGASPVAIEADIQDSGSGVSHVQFFAGYDTGGGWGWHSLGYDLDGVDGWSASWMPSGLTELTEVGLYVFAWDQAGNTAGSPVLHLNLSDGLPPTSAVEALPETIDTTAVQVAWQGTDNLSGIDRYDLQAQVDGGAWQNWLTGVSASQTSAVYFGQLGHSYAFRVRAVDKAGNAEAFPAGADAATTINACSTDAYEADNSLANAKTLALGQAHSHTICGLGDQDWLSLSVQAGKVYQIMTSNLGSDTDTLLGVYNAAGILLAENNDAFPGLVRSSYLIYTAPTNGTIYLKIMHTDARIGGNAVSYDVIAAVVQLSFVPVAAK